MSRRLEIKKEKVERVKLVKVTSENIKEVAQNIADTMVVGGENNVWECVNTMVHVTTPNEVIECLYKMVSNLVDCTNYTISNPFIDECEDVKKAFEEVACSNISGMDRIKALLLSKVDSECIKGIKEGETVIGKCITARRISKGDINIYKLKNGNYLTYCSCPWIEFVMDDANKVIEWLDKEIQ